MTTHRFMLRGGIIELTGAEVGDLQKQLSEQRYWQQISGKPYPAPIADPTAGFWCLHHRVDTPMSGGDFGPRTPVTEIIPQLQTAFVRAETAIDAIRQFEQRMSRRFSLSQKLAAIATPISDKPLITTQLPAPVAVVIPTPSPTDPTYLLFDGEDEPVPDHLVEGELEEIMRLLAGIFDDADSAQAFMCSHSDYFRSTPMALIKRDHAGVVRVIEYLRQATPP